MNQKKLDLRSDTVTRPVEGMRKAMFDAELGDDVYGDDPTVNRLQEVAADLTGKQASVFVPSGTQSNLIALLTHCQRGDEYIVGHDAHTYKYEGGGAAALGGIQPQTVAFDEQAQLPLEQVASVIKPDDSHFARTRLLTLENTQHGRVVSLEYLESAREFCNEHKLALHLDGARVCNAAVALDVTVKQITQHFDTVSICLSKGLGSPVGSILCGSADFIKEARRWRKVTGGGMRQAGMLAAAGIYSLEQMIDRMADDHANAKQLEKMLASAPGISVRSDWTQTNMLWLDLDENIAQPLRRKAAENNILISAEGGICRLVMHHDIAATDVNRVGQVLNSVLTEITSTTEAGLNLNHSAAAS